MELHTLSHCNYTILFNTRSTCSKLQASGSIQVTSVDSHPHSAKFQQSLKISMHISVSFCCFVCLVLQATAFSTSTVHTAKASESEMPAETG